MPSTELLPKALQGSYHGSSPQAGQRRLRTAQGVQTDRPSQYIG